MMVDDTFPFSTQKEFFSIKYFDSSYISFLSTMLKSKKKKNLATEMTYYSWYHGTDVIKFYIKNS
jgi:hypothetical protein